MSTYTLKCEDCREVFTISAKMSEMDEQYCRGIICPSCNMNGHCKQVIQPSVIVSGHHTNHKVPDSFKDTITRIKKHYPRNKINI